MPSRTLRTAWQRAGPNGTSDYQDRCRSQKDWEREMQIIRRGTLVLGNRYLVRQVVPPAVVKA